MLGSIASSGTLTFRPHRIAKVINSLICVLLTGGSLAIWIYASVPSWIIMTVLGVSLYWIGFTASLFFRFIELSNEGIHVAIVKRRFHAWPQITSWSQLGESGSIFFKDHKSHVFGFDRWCVFGHRIDVVAQHLHNTVGPPATGTEAVIPLLLRGIVQVSNGRPVTEAEQSTGKGNASRGSD